MSYFSVMVREHAYTGRFYNDVVEAESCEQALQLAAGQASAPRLQPGSGQRSFTVTVTESTPATFAGRFHDDVVDAGSCEQALQLAAGQVSGPRAPAGSEPQPDDADRRRCADVWLHSLLRCELAEKHDPPHMAAARGYWRPVRWVRDDRGLAHALPEPDTDPP